MFIEKLQILNQNQSINLLILFKFYSLYDFYYFSIHLTPNTYVNELFKGLIKMTEVLQSPEL